MPKLFRTQPTPDDPATAERRAGKILRRAKREVAIRDLLTFGTVRLGAVLVALGAVVVAVLTTRRRKPRGSTSRSDSHPRSRA